MGGRNILLKDNTQSQKQPQLYDTTLKALFADEATGIISYLFPGAELLGKPSDEERNIEIDRSTLKADLVYRIRYKGEPIIFNPELQTDNDMDMEYRVLQYHAGLRAKHKVPVLSVIIYLFKCSVRLPPYEERCGDELFLAFHPKVICLWELNAEPIVKEHIISLYALLPTMRGAKADLLSQALKEMAQRYSRQQLDKRIIWFGLMLSRATTMSDEDKQIVEEELRVQYHYDELIDTNPLVLERVARGKVEGQVETLRKSILKILRNRFSASLVDLAEQALGGIENVEVLDKLEDLAFTSDEQSLRASLTQHLPSQ